MRSSSWIQRLSSGGVLLLLVAASACSSSSSSPSPFNGTWTCTNTATYTFTSPAKEAPVTRMTTSSLVIDISSGSDVTISAGEADAGATCSVRYATDGATASLAAGQTCPLTFTSGDVTYATTVDFTTGSGTVSDGTLTFTQSDSFTGTATSGAVSVALDGTVSSQSVCTN